MGASMVTWNAGNPCVAWGGPEVLYELRREESLDDDVVRVRFFMMAITSAGPPRKTYDSLGQEHPFLTDDVLH